MTEDEVITEFMEQWETQEADGIITRAEWIDYYTDVSASIDDDDYFELMMRNAWHIAGGEGATANTSIPRHLVIDADGTQHVEMMAGAENMQYDMEGAKTSYAGEI